MKGGKPSRVEKGHTWDQPNNSGGKMGSESDTNIDTASAVIVKFGTINSVGKKLTTCQELRLFFGNLDREGMEQGPLSLKRGRWWKRR